MSQFFLHQQYVFHLDGGYIEGALMGNMTPEEAYSSLKYISNQDFGYDVEAWKKWFNDNNFDTVYQGLIHGAKNSRKSNQDLNT